MERRQRLIPFLLSACMLGGVALPGWSKAAPPYPTRVIRLVVSFPPGGGTDIIARTLGQRLGEEFSQSIVIDNRGGAGGNLGAELAARANPDGHTLFIGAATHAINMTLYQRPGYDLAKDFSAVSVVASIPYTLVSNPTLPARTIAEFLKLAKERPGRLNYGSAGSGTGTHLAMEILRSTVGISLVHIPYKGSAPAVTELLANQVQVMFGNTASVLPQVKSNRLRALGISSARRLEVMPDVPTIAESGVTGFEVLQWYGIFVPAGTPPDRIARLHAGLSKVVQTREFRDRIFAEGGEAVHNTPKEFSAFVQTEIARWAKAVRDSGAKVD